MNLAVTYRMCNIHDCIHVGIIMINIALCYCPINSAWHLAACTSFRGNLQAEMHTIASFVEVSMHYNYVHARDKQEVL